MTPTNANGQCLCGAINFSASFPSKWVAHCHCTRCQRAHGAAFVTWVGMDAKQVSIQDPGGSLNWYQTPGGGDRAFCGNCGSSLFFRSDRWPGELHVARALFVDPIDREPQAHAYFDTHVPWITVADGLPTQPDSERETP